MSVLVKRYSLIFTCLLLPAFAGAHSMLLINLPTTALEIPFYNNTWFLILSLFCIGLLAYILYKSGLRKADERMKDEIAKRSTQLKEQFLANMSHEFRTPLNAIVGMTRLLRDNNPNSDQINYLNAIGQSSENLMAIINDILDITKIEAGRIILLSIPFEPRAIVQGVYDNFHLKALEKNINYTISVNEKVPQILTGDPLRLTQLLGNVVANAIKFTDQGSVDLHCSVSAFPNSSDQPIRLKFIIKDTGIGIAEINQEIIFTSFSQESSDTTRKYGGAGLGLTITKKLTELFEGNIKVESESGVGSTFAIELPFGIYTGADIGKKDNQTSAELRKALKGISVLLVEDIEFNRIVALDTLVNEIDDVQVEIAADGNEAVELCSKKLYDVILMDLQMPVMNGYDASRIIRAMPVPNCHVPIIAMTASALEDEIYRCYDAGMNDFITKPFDTDTLFRKMLNQINKFS